MAALAAARGYKSRYAEATYILYIHIYSGTYPVAMGGGDDTDTVLGYICMLAETLTNDTCELVIYSTLAKVLET